MFFKIFGFNKKQKLEYFIKKYKSMWPTLTSFKKIEWDDIFETTKYDDIRVLRFIKKNDKYSYWRCDVRRSGRNFETPSLYLMWGDAKHDKNNENQILHYEVYWNRDNTKLDIQKYISNIELTLKDDYLSFKAEYVDPFFEAVLSGRDYDINFKFLGGEELYFELYALYKYYNWCMHNERSVYKTINGHKIVISAGNVLIDGNRVEGVYLKNKVRDFCRFLHGNNN